MPVGLHIPPHGEMELPVRAGLTPVEALRAATSAPARDRGAASPVSKITTDMLCSCRRTRVHHRGWMFLYNPALWTLHVAGARNTTEARSKCIGRCFASTAVGHCGYLSTAN